jgi:GH24 family phage-related lysozyme (muramidase)
MPVVSVSKVRAVATTRIPGAFNPAAHSWSSEGDDPWRSIVAHRGVHHLPGPVGGAYHDRSWRTASFVAPADRENVDVYYKVLTLWEGLVCFMYLDTKGYVTVGIGNLLKTVAAAQALPFQNTSTGETATQLEIETAYNAVLAMKPQKPKGASYYKLVPSIELDAEYARMLARERLRKEFLPAIRRRFPEFDRYPMPAREFMVDMAYNGGPGYFAKRHMTDLIEQQKWLETIARVPTEGNPKRRAWRETQLRLAASQR